MSCIQGCNNCKCEEIDVNSGKESIYQKLNDKLRVLLETTCALSAVPCSRLGSFMAKVIYMIWCLLKDLSNMTIKHEERLANIERRLSVLETKVR